MEKELTSFKLYIQKSSDPFIAKEGIEAFLGDGDEPGWYDAVVKEKNSDGTYSVNWPEFDDEWVNVAAKHIRAKGKRVKLITFFLQFQRPELRLKIKDVPGNVVSPFPRMLKKTFSFLKET